MPNISSIVKNVRNIMRNEDQGISGDAQRLEQLGWMLFLKIMDEKDQELELIREGYKSVIPGKFQWRNWASDPEGITGDELLLFIDHPTDGLFAKLKEVKAPQAPQRAARVHEVFDGLNNYMKSGFAMRKVINQLNGFDFNNSDDRHIFGTIYESILIELRDAGNKGEYYTPRAITLRMPDDKATRLRTLARQRGISLNKLLEEFSTRAIAEFDTETRFRLRAASGNSEKALKVLDALDTHFQSA